ncbi:hypothetical protein BFP70_11205 [Thioclava sp. SK-1]|uniref:hypothetical protein n=1 Tax=Thioclava sp. SK-1 TaxID=1889770 RepID=UPI000825495B|nr:hypothetical protein [Thioclava sp. SK-1]OCX64587.1 hypothetical protein BFP70_11205 [Thioclava sp. SK-1]
MDRITGLNPQVGWSPLLLTPALKVAPATTVEAVVSSANVNGGMGGSVDTQTGEGKAAAALAQSVKSRTSTDEAAQSVSSSDLLSAPAGPPPTFRVTQLQQEAARLRAGMFSASTDAAAVETATPAQSTPVVQETRSTSRSSDGTTTETVTTMTRTVTSRAPTETPPETAETKKVELEQVQAEIKQIETRTTEPEAAPRGYETVAAEPMHDLDVTR